MTRAKATGVGFCDLKTPEETLRQWLNDKIVFDASLLPGYKRGVYTRAQMSRISRMFTPTAKDIANPLSLFNTNKLMGRVIEKLGVLKAVDFFSVQNIIRYKSLDDLYAQCLRVAGI